MKLTADEIVKRYYKIASPSLKKRMKRTEKSL